MSLDFVAIDFETANQSRGSVIQIGLAKARDGQIVKTAVSYVIPHPTIQRFDGRCVRVHGIKPPDIKGAPGWPEILGRLVKFTGGLPLVGHNVAFERSCIDSATELHGLPPALFDYYDSLKLARMALPNEPSHSLAKLSASIGLPSFGHHDAAADAEASARLVFLIADRLGVDSLGAMPVGRMRVKRPAAAAA